MGLAKVLKPIIKRIIIRSSKDNAAADALTEKEPKEDKEYVHKGGPGELDAK